MSDTTDFTEQELYAAFVLFMPDTEARREAKDYANREVVIDSRYNIRAPDPHEIMIVYSDDVLVALSFVSEGTARKVERYRLQRSGGQLSSDEERDWNLRRERFHKGLAAMKMKRPTGI